MPIPNVVTPIPGPQSLALYQREQASIAPGLQSVTQWARVCFSHGRDCALFDLDGNTILDFMAGIAVSSIGHAHPKHVAAIAEQAGKLTAGGFTSEPRVALLETMRDILPPSLSRMQFYSGGAEAVEAALRLARCATGRSMVVGFWGGYHGKTEGTRPLSEGEQVGYGLPSPGIVSVPYANPRVNPFDAPEGEVIERTIQFLRDMVEHGTNKDIAAIIVEPVQGRGGNIVPPPGFLRAVRDVAHDLGALFICDEMITGFYRTGKPFAFMHDDAVPDILIMGKGFGNGYPISGIATTEAVASSEPWAKPSGNSSSYGGNALACAAALATVQVLRDEQLGANASEVGAHMLRRLRRLVETSPIVTDVRGKGLLIGIELAQENGKPMPRDMMRGIFTDILSRGLLVMPSGSSLRINPPLTLTRELADAGCEVLEQVLAGVTAEMAV